MKKRVLCLMLTMMLVLGLVACGDKKETNVSNGGTKSEVSSTVADNVGNQVKDEPTTNAEDVIEYVEPTAAELGYKYDAVLQGISVYQYKGKERYIKIPAQINGEPVKEIGVFYINSSVKGIEIPEGVTNLKANAFKSWKNLLEIKLPDSVTTIGTSVFEGCKSLKEIIIPKNIAVIEEKMFKDCEKLEKVTFSGNVTTIGKQAFYMCIALKDIKLPLSVTDIGVGAFMNCQALTEFTIPEGIEVIKAQSFDGCKSLISINVPKSVTAIHAGAFSYCMALRNLEIHDGVKTIYNGAFNNSSALTVTYKNNSYNYSNFAELYKIAK